ncbi:MaoC/PaaZ C-terminal domain-containing protein [Rhodococcus phenolicus]|uniref:MaoC/PaaZ C-terminal domain-containing protein n=1 Tax=Rhodococcus phenolicus TaxID=263849 RepID=UPI00316AE815
MEKILGDAISLTRRAVLRADGTPASQLEALVRTWVLFHTSRRSEALIGASEIRSLDDVGRRLVITLRDHQEQLFHEVIDRGVAVGAFTTPHPREAARAVINMGYSIASWYRPGGELSPDELAERYAGLALGTVGATLAGAECTHETPGSTAQVASPHRTARRSASPHDHGHRTARTSRAVATESDCPRKGFTVPALTTTVGELTAFGHHDFGCTEWMTVDQQRIDTFADATDDHQWIHVDPQQASSGPFGSTVAHGYLTLSLVPRLLEQLLTLTDQVRGTNYGIDRVRFTNPVPVGSEIRLAARLTEAHLRSDGGVQYKIAVRVDLRGQDRPAMVGESIYLAYAA